MLFHLGGYAFHENDIHSMLAASLHADIALDAKLNDINNKLDLIQKGIKTIMATEQQALDLILKIDVATTQQGTVLTAEQATLQTISDEFDAFLANPPAGVPDSVITALQAQSDKVQAVADSLGKQAAFSTAIAAKGTTTVPPVPPATS